MDEPLLGVFSTQGTNHYDPCWLSYYFLMGTSVNTSCFLYFGQNCFILKVLPFFDTQKTFNNPEITSFGKFDSELPG
jgi:hypothetical protein